MNTTVTPTFRVTTVTPDGDIVAVEVLDREQLDERLPHLTFVTEQLPGWSVQVEPQP